MKLPAAVLLIGPTGSGKTPFGEWLQTAGLWGRRCHHFDFGVHLRAVAEWRRACSSVAEVRFIQDVVHRGALLEDESFPLALRMLFEFAADRAPGKGDLLVMNGLPRHKGQAASLAPHGKIVAVLEFRCSAPVVMHRLRHNSGGDRSGRADDRIELVEHKLLMFERRTRPLLEYYRAIGVPLLPLNVGAESVPREPAGQLPSHIPPGNE